MRDIPSGLATLQALRSRKPTSRMVVRDIRLRFDTFTQALNPFYTDNPGVWGTATPNVPLESSKRFMAWDHDISPSSGTICGVVGYNNLTYFRRVTTPGTAGQWATWTSIVGTGTISNCKPGIVRADNGNWYIYTLETTTGIVRVTSTDDGATWGSEETVDSTWPASGYATLAALAPISDVEVFSCAVDNSGAVQRLTVYRHYKTGAVWARTEWPNTLFDSVYSYQAMTYFDAVKLDNGVRLVFFSSKDNGRAMVCSWFNGVWGTPKPLIPLDLVDTTSLFRLTSAKVIQDVIWVAGRLVRPGSEAGYEIGLDIAMRSVDGEYWTLDRNAYLQSTEGQGQLLLGQDNYVYYACIGSIYRAPATYLIDPAGDPAGEKTTLTDDESIVDWSYDIPTADGAAGSLDANVADAGVLVWPTEPMPGWQWDDGHQWPVASPAGVYWDHPNVKGGAWLWLYAGYDGGDYVELVWPDPPSADWQWDVGVHIWPYETSSTKIYTLLDIVDIDQIGHEVQDGNRQVNIAGRSVVSKMLNQRSLQDYMFLSQTKWTDEYADLGRLVSIGGTWTTASNILTASDAINTNLLWFSGVEGVSSGLSWPQIRVQYRFDSTTTGKASGIVLLGLDQDNYWYVKATPTQIELVERVAGVDGAAVATYAKAHSADTWYHLLASYRGGRFLVYVRNVGTAAWTEAIDYTHATANLPAFGRSWGEGLLGLRADVATIVESSETLTRTGSEPYVYHDPIAWDLSAVTTSHRAYKKGDSSRWGNITVVDDGGDNLTVSFTDAGFVIEAGVAIQVVDPASTIAFQRPVVFDERWDYNTASLIQEIATVGGVTAYNLDKTVDAGSQALDWWSSFTDTDVDLWFDLPVMPDANKHVFVGLRADIADWATMTGLALGLKWTGSLWQAKSIHRDGTVYDASTDDQEVFDLDPSPNNDDRHRCRIVLKGNFLTLYVGRYPVACFWDGTYTAAGYLGLATDNPSANLTATNLWTYDLREWRSAEFLEMGEAAGQALSNLIDDRDIHFFGRGLALRASDFGTRDNLGTWDDVVFQDQAGPSDVERVSLLRIVGAEIAESLNATVAQEQGLIFAEAQASAAENAAQILSQAQSLLTRARQYAEQHRVAIPALLEVEPEDLVTISYTSPDSLWAVSGDYLVNDISYSLAAALAEAEAGVRLSV